MTGLLVGPWQVSEATRHPELPPYLIVIDALDEIKGDGGSLFLRDLLIAINEYDLKGFKFLVTSRSDPKIAALCESFTSKAVCRLQDVPIEEAKSDIETYLKTQLLELAGSPEFAELGRRGGGLFIYAAMAVKYLTRSRLESRPRCLTTSFPNHTNQLLQVMLHPLLTNYPADYVQCLFKAQWKSFSSLIVHPLHIPVHG